MAAKLTRMAEGGATIVGERRKDGGELGESFMTGVTKVTMPQGGGGGDEGLGSRRVRWVQRPGAIAPDDQFPGQEILHRTTSRVKLS